MTAKLPASEVRRLFEYSDGVLIWRARPLTDFVSRRACSIWHRRFSGLRAGYVQKMKSGDRRRVSITIKGTTVRYYASQLVWAWHKGVWPSELIDHEDGDTGNNRIGNLRDVPHAANSQNARIHVDNTSGVTGVCWQKTRQKWKAEIMANGVKKHIGVFDDFKAAVAARKAAEREYGFHPNHGRRVNV